MNVWLLYQDRDFDRQGPLPVNAAALTQDLELETVFAAMAGGDEFLLEVARQVVMTSLFDPDAINYRQQILADCLEHAELIRTLYALGVEAIEREKKAWGWLMARSPDGVLHRSIETLKQFTGLLARLRQVAIEHRADFHSDGFTRLFEMLVRELDDEYLQAVETHVRRLQFPDGVLVSAGLGQGNKGINYVLLEPPSSRQTWVQRLQNWRERLTTAEYSSYTYQIAERDEAGLRSLSELRSEGISAVAASLGRSSDHILAFFAMLRLELGFYVGCLNLRERLLRNEEPVCMPAVVASGLSVLSAQGLYDASLSLQTGEHVVGNHLSADGKRLIMITGANRGGKSTLLRALGQAHLMMQAGMFVAAQSFRAEVCRGLFTHFKREEDPGMRSGKFDEELARMSGIVDRLTAGSIMLFNESFASTNEREGSEIARQVVNALLEAAVKVIFVTHLFDLAQGFYHASLDTALFLRAERLADGRRTFRVLPGEPSPTSFGEDLYRRIFDATAQGRATG